MSHTWLVRLPPRTDDRSRVDDAAATAGLRGGVVAEKPVVALGDSRLDCARLDPEAVSYTHLTLPTIPLV